MFLEELLILTFQLGVEHHAMNDRTILAQSLGLALVRLVDLRVVKQLAWALKAGVEVLLALVPVALQDVAATLGEDDERRPSRIGMVRPPLLTQVPEFAAVRVEDCPGRPGGRRRARRGTRRPSPAPANRSRATSRSVAGPDALAFWAARQLEIPSEHLTRVSGVLVREGCSSCLDCPVEFTS